MSGEITILPLEAYQAFLELQSEFFNDNIVGSISDEMPGGFLVTLHQEDDGPYFLHNLFIDLNPKITPRLKTGFSGLWTFGRSEDSSSPWASGTYSGAPTQAGLESFSWEEIYGAQHHPFQQCLKAGLQGLRSGGIREPWSFSIPDKKGWLYVDQARLMGEIVHGEEVLFGPNSTNGLIEVYRGAYTVNSHLPGYPFPR